MPNTMPFSAATSSASSENNLNPKKKKLLQKLEVYFSFCNSLYCFYSILTVQRMNPVKS